MLKKPRCEKCGGFNTAPCPAGCGMYFCECGHDHDSDRECK